MGTRKKIEEAEEVKGKGEGKGKEKEETKPKPRRKPTVKAPVKRVVAKSRLTKAEQVKATASKSRVKSTVKAVAKTTGRKKASTSTTSVRSRKKVVKPVEEVQYVEEAPIPEVEQVEQVEPEQEPIYMYKVVAIHDDGGFISPGIYGKLALRYFAGQVTRTPLPLLEKGYGILVFPTAQRAWSWGGFTGREVWKVRIGKVMDCPNSRIPRSLSYNINSGIEEGQWDSIAEWLIRHVRFGRAWPYNSKMADWVELVERIENPYS